MNFEFFDPKAEWPKADPDFHICGKHKVDAVLVTYRSAECPLCCAEKKLRRHAEGLDVAINMVTASLRSLKELEK